jgi:hypothetical protein
MTAARDRESCHGQSTIIGLGGRAEELTLIVRSI